MTGGNARLKMRIFFLNSWVSSSTDLEWGYRIWILTNMNRWFGHTKYMLRNKHLAQPKPRLLATQLERESLAWPPTRGGNACASCVGECCGVITIWNASSVTYACRWQVLYPKSFGFLSYLTLYSHHSYLSRRARCHALDRKERPRGQHEDVRSSALDGSGGPTFAHSCVPSTHICFAR